VKVYNVFPEPAPTFPKKSCLDTTYCWRKNQFFDCVTLRTTDLNTIYARCWNHFGGHSS